MALTRPWAIDAAFPNAADHRKQLASIYPREGVFPDPLTILPAGIAYAGTGWGVSARPFVAALKRGGAAYSAAYGAALVSNDAAVANAWTITAAPASGSRIDLLCIRARDTTQGDSATGTPTDGPAGAQRSGFPEFMVVTGTAATTPTAPALPAGYEEIARIQTPSGAASTAGSTITQTYNFAHVVGSPIVVRNATELDALTSVLGIDSAYQIDKDAVLVRRAGGWVPSTPKVYAAFRQLAADNQWVDKTTLTDFPQAADAAALALSFDKISATSDVRIVWSVTEGDLNSGTAQLINFGLNIGGVDYTVGAGRFQTAIYRTPFGGTRVLTGIPRGVLAVKPRISTSAANFYLRQGAQVAYTLEEV